MFIRMPDEDELGGHLAQNVVAFARFLRRAGMVVGTGQVIDALHALELVGFAHRQDVYGALHAVFVSRADQVELFDLGFQAFWRAPFGNNEDLMHLLPPTRMDGFLRKKPAPRRLKDAWQGPGKPRPRGESPPPPELDVDRAGTASHREVLRTTDFEQMSAAELTEVRKRLQRMRFPWKEVKRRRTRTATSGRLDLARTLRRSLPTFGEPLGLAWREPLTRHPPLVVLLDVSGSMERYSRMLLHFLHALTNDRDRVHVFTFGTRLENISRALRQRDPDTALFSVSNQVKDFSGGTRIGSSLAEFNRVWARRVLGQGAIVLLVTDGLERDEDPVLGAEMARLHRMSRRLIWLNPLLRFDGFQPLAAGVRTMLPHVDEFRPCHNLASLDALVAALGPGGDQRPH